MVPSLPPPTFKARLRVLAVSRVGRWLLGALTVSLFVLLGGVVVRQARARAWRLPAYRLGPFSVRYVGLHPALGPLVERSLLDERMLRFSISVFDADAEEKVRKVIARHPMVAKVRSVQVRYPDRVCVRVDVREPAAWFEVTRANGGKGKGYVLVSTDGVLLDPGCYAHYRRRLRVPLPRVLGVKARHPGRYGRAWEDRPEQVAEGVAAARVAARLYRDFNGMLHVKVIDVRSFPATPELRSRGEIRFRLDDGTVVEWGRTDRDVIGVAGEDPYETKRWRLETELTQRGPGRRERIDVRFRLPGEGYLLPSKR